MTGMVRMVLALSYDSLRICLGGTPAENGVAFRALLNGDHGAYRDAVLLNAAAALLVADKVSDLLSGVELARDSIDSGRALRAVQTLARISQDK